MLTRYRTFLPTVTVQSEAATVSGANATKKTSPSNIEEFDSTIWFSGSVNFQPRSLAVTTAWVEPLTSTKSTLVAMS